MQVVSKKSSKVGSIERKNQRKISHSRNNSRTDNSPSAKRSQSKDMIKVTLKKVCQENTQDYRPSSQTKQQQKANKLRNKMQILIPNIRTSLTPKGLNNTIARPDSRQRQVQSTKAADGAKMFTNSGRYDLKQLFEKNRNDISKEKQELSTGKIVRKSEQKKIQDATIKIHREDDFDVSTVLTNQEIQKFGDRFPDKFKRIALLGRGGFSVVWLGVHRSSKRKVAVKQILSRNPHQTHLKQIWFGSYFFQKGGEPREQFENHIGINNICKLYSYEIKSVDTWLFYEVCENSLGSAIFELKPQINNGEKSYKMHYKELILKMRENIGQLKNLIVEVSKALYLINSHNIVHSDLKTQNILIKMRKKEDGAGPCIKSLKLIDFGSSFLFTNLKQFSMATPQYMPPEILNYILFQNKLEYDVMMLNKMEKYKNPWVIDVWSLGCIVLEIITGVPLWMSLPTRIEDKSNIKATGLFAVKGRLFNKIIQKQMEVVNNLDRCLSEENHSGIFVDRKLKQLLKRMLSLQPDERISPHEILTYFGVQCESHRIPFY